jgi:hypothetical protein
MQKIQTWYYASYFVVLVGTLAALEWLWFGWYFITDFDPVTTIKRINSNKCCPKTVLKLYEHYRLSKS